MSIVWSTSSLHCPYVIAKHAVKFAINGQKQWNILIDPRILCMSVEKSLDEILGRLTAQRNV